jgi:hypothetical protein
MDSKQIVLDMIGEFGGIDGGHHKQWLLNEILLSLMTQDEYEKWVAEWEDGADGPNTYSWDIGIAP